MCILTVVDEATRYTTVRILNSERAPEFVKGLEIVDPALWSSQVPSS